MESNLVVGDTQMAKILILQKIQQNFLGLSTKVTSGNFFCLEVEISVER